MSNFVTKFGTWKGILWWHSPGPLFNDKPSPDKMEQNGQFFGTNGTNAT